MQEALAQVVSYCLGIWRHRWLALAVAWCLAIGGWLFVWQLPESYVATARISVDSNSVLRPLMKGLTISPDINQRIAMMSRTLLSRPNLEQLATMTDLDLQVVTDADKESLITELEDSIALEGSRRNSSLYSIRVTHQDRETARRIAQSLITIFIETSMSDKRQDSSGAQTFLAQQILESEERLIEAEARLALFKQRNVDVLPSWGGDYYSNLQYSRGELEQAQLELREVENRRRELQRQVDGADPAALEGSSPAADSPVGMRIESLRAQRDKLLIRYTEKHPEVVRLDAMIDSLEDEYSDMLTSGADPSLAGSPVYQELRSMLASTEVEAAQLRVRVDEFQRRVDDLSSMVNEIPEVEAELKQLNRDYDVISDQHQQLLKRREAARLSGDVESNSGDISFRVIDPPFVPLEPSDPNKFLLNIGVLLAAVGGGAGAALLLALVHPIVTDARMLSQVTGLPLLGTVTWNKADAQKTADRWQLAGYSVCVFALLATFSGIVFVPQIFFLGWRIQYEHN